MSSASMSAIEHSKIAGPGETLPTRPFDSTDEFIVRGDPENGTRQNLNLLLGVVGGKVNIGRGAAAQCGGAVPVEQQWVAAKCHAVLQFRLRLLDTDSRGPAGSSRLPLDYSRRIQASPFRWARHVNLEARGASHLASRPSYRCSYTERLRSPRRSADRDSARCGCPK